MRARNRMIDTVQKWLEGEGFPLEMHVAAEFRKAGFEVRQSSHYVDAETGKGREIDVVARDPDPMGIVEIYFAIECKSSKKPWVLLTSPDTLSGYNRIFAFGVLSEKAVDVFAQRILEFVETLPWLRKEDATGYAFRQAFGGQSDHAYSAAFSVAKACEYLVRPPERGYVAPFGLVFPVVVVDAPLIRCVLGRGSRLNLQEVDEGEFLFFAHLPRYFGSCIRVVTLQHLPVFAREAKRAARQFRAALKPEEEKIVASWHRSKHGSSEHNRTIP